MKKDMAFLLEKYGAKVGATDDFKADVLEVFETLKRKTMKTKIKVEQEVEITTLEVRAGVRCWEDATVNGEEDAEGTLIPFRDGDYWCPIIDIDSGIIKDWPKGMTADIHYKVCDDGSYWLKNEDGACILAIEDNYVPDILSPKERGYGDYIILNVGPDGKIDGWRGEIDDFIDDEDNNN